MTEGDAPVMELHGDELRVRPARAAPRRIQERLGADAPETGLVPDELIEGRRQEAAGG